MKNYKAQNRIFWLDVARVCAVFFIALNHTVNRTFNQYNQIEEYINSSFLMQIVKAMLTSCSWLGVPLFLMITGVLFLKRSINSEEDIKKFYNHNVIPTLVSVMVWLLIGYLFITLVINNGMGGVLLLLSVTFFT